MTGQYLFTVSGVADYGNKSEDASFSGSLGLSWMSEWGLPVQMQWYTVL